MPQFCGEELVSAKFFGLTFQQTFDERNVMRFNNCHWSLTITRTLLAAMLSFVLAAATVAGDYYVSPTGNNLTGNGSLAKPWKTIQYSVGNIFESNATLHVAAGTYQVTRQV